MAKILVYNNDTLRIETYYKELNEPMPYVTSSSLTVGEFRGSSNSDLMWTTKRFMQNWNRFRTGWGKSIRVGYGFKRIWQGGHAGMSQHYAGVALDIGQGLSSSERDRLRNYAINSKLFSYVEPKVLTPTWVHIDNRYGKPACTTGGYPLVKQGSKNTYVMVLQDALTYLGYNLGGIDGMFGARTSAAVRSFQRSNNLTADGIVGCKTWRILVNKI